MPEGSRSWEPVPGGSAPAGAYSPAIRVGELVFVSGQVPPRDPGTGRAEGSVREQTRVVLERLRAVLETAGASLDDVVSVSAYLEDIGDWAEFNEVYAAAFRPPYPTRTTVGARLAGVKVEISAIAHVRR